MAAVIGFFTGVFVGTIFGVVIMSLMVAAGRSNRHEEGETDSTSEETIRRAEDGAFIKQEARCKRK